MAKGGYRAGAGRPKGSKTGSSKKKSKPDEIPQDIKDEANAANLDPLDYMLKVMNSEEADAGRRDRMAIAAAPFMHSRKGEGLGKKEDQEARAKTAGAGKFSASAPPKLAVVKK